LDNLMLKRDLTSEQLSMVGSEVEIRKKSKTIAYVLWWFTGVLGGHRFYVGVIGYAICLLLFGWLTAFIWNLVDVFFIGKRLEQKTTQLEYEVIQRVKLVTGSKTASV
jgi:hypothetical protein